MALSRGFTVVHLDLSCESCMGLFTIKNGGYSTKNLMEETIKYALIFNRRDSQNQKFSSIHDFFKQLKILQIRVEGT